VHVIQRPGTDVLTPRTADRNISSNSVEPRIESGISPKRTQFLPRQNKRLLSHIQCVFTGVQDMLKAVNQPLLVTPHEVIKRARISLQSHRDELQV
jgi:hypothetical protein